MARPTLSLVFFALLTYAAYRIVLSILSARRFKAFAKQHGCKDPHYLTGPTPFYSMRKLWELTKINQTGQDFLDDFVGSDFQHSTTIKAMAFEGSVMLNTTDPENIQALLATQFKDFEVGEQRHNVFRPLLGRSIFTSDGAFWEHSRALFRPQFARENINDLAMTERASGDLIDAIGTADSRGWTAGTDVMPLLYSFTLDTATDFLFGESIESQAALTAERRGQRIDATADPTRAAKLEDAKKFVDCFEVINSTMLTRFRTGSLYWLFGDSLAFRRALRTVHRFAEHFVNMATDTKLAETKSERRKDGLLNALANQTQDREELRGQTLSILLAGRDTTAALLGWCLARLALHPQIQHKLRTIILRDLPSDEPITFEKLKSIRYLQHFLNEVLRLHPTVPFNARVAVKDTTLPVGGGADGRAPIAVAKGQRVLFCVYLMHRRKDLWGQDALEFKPERWEERVAAWNFLPFLGGPRICIGQQFALTEAGFLLCRILQEYDAIEPVDRTELARLRKGLSSTMWPDDARMRFHKAEQ